MPKVYVISQSGNPIMPTERFGKVRRMLKSGEAVVVQLTPFTIRLTRESGEAVQETTLGVDPGSKKIGLSVTTEKEELYASEVSLRTDVVENLSTRKQLRRGRRSRKTRYRAPRFKNRHKSKPKGWIAPSIRQKIGTHLKVIKDICKILPIKNIVVESASFDVQKIKNPEISGKEHQEGELLGFWNVREYVLFRDDHTCQHCSGKSGDKVLNVHHLESRKTGGNAITNLLTLCETCHGKVHAGKIKLKVTRGKKFNDAAFMGIMRKTLFRELKELYPNVRQTYGYITKNTRIREGLEKGHAVDARCISGNPNAAPADEIFMQKATRRHNRQLHKCKACKGGYRKANQTPKYVFGFQLFDKVRFADGRVGFVFGRRALGSFDVRALSGEKYSSGISYKKLQLKEARKTILCERTTRKEGQEKSA